jgi:hypothetical protein
MGAQPMARPNMESRWGPALTLFAMLVVVALLPMRLALLPQWVRFVLAAFALFPTIAVTITRGTRRSLAIERTAHLTFFVLVAVLTFVALAQLIYMMVRRSSELSGVTLLSSSLIVWVVNIGSNSIVYWQIDRGGPEARLRGDGVLPDWIFPQDDESNALIRPDWRPCFVDYFYLAYSTATAFSTTEVAPVTPRAKLLMMFESSISLVVIVLVGARAVNILA